MAGPDRFARIVIIAWAIVGVLVLFELARGLIATGVLASVTSVSPGVCRAIVLPGPTDLALDAADGTLFIATRSGIYALALEKGEGQPVKLAGTPADFQPNALSLGHDPDGALALVAINQRKTGHFSVESFGLHFENGVPRISYAGSMQSRALAHPGGVAALGAMRFYVANDPAQSDMLVWLDRYGVLPRADLLFFNGLTFRQAVNGLSDPSAVALSPDGRQLFLASRNERRLIIFDLDPFSGDLKQTGLLALPLRPQRIGLDGNGDLWVAGAVNLASPAPSKVLRVHVGADGAPHGYDTVFADDGKRIDGASAALRFKKHLFIASAASGMMLDCQLP